ncbi:MAG: hypothetical protein H6876_06450 [Hyphomicrobiaceae bacterium]|nr:hypothetical protein [Hyphomicrobiaceae bacterium]
MDNTPNLLTESGIERAIETYARTLLVSHDEKQLTAHAHKLIDQVATHIRASHGTIRPRVMSGLVRATRAAAQREFPTVVREMFEALDLSQSSANPKSS